jgi:hypothetical protein
VCVWGEGGSALYFDKYNIKELEKNIAWYSSHSPNHANACDHRNNAL